MMASLLLMSEGKLGVLGILIRIYNTAEESNETHHKQSFDGPIVNISP